MQVFEISDIKNFTNHLFVGALFDSFSMTEASFTTFASTILDGTLKPDFFDTEEQKLLKEEHKIYAAWKDMKPIAIAAIKGKTLPLGFHIILRINDSMLSHPVFAELSPKDTSYFLNIKFKENTLTCTTGTSTSVFQIGVRPDSLWDHAVFQFFKENKIEFEMI